MRILSFAEFVAAGTAAAAAKNGTAASFLKNDRRIIMVGLRELGGIIPPLFAGKSSIIRGSLGMKGEKPGAWRQVYTPWLSPGNPKLLDRARREPQIGPGHVRRHLCAIKCSERHGRIHRIGYCARKKSGEVSLLSTAPDSPIAAPDLGTAEPPRSPGRHASAPVLSVLTALSFSHLLNDTMQSLIPAIYPILKSALHLDFVHIGLITLTNQLTASILQPFVGFYTDRRPQPFSLAVAMSFTLAGLVLLAFASSLALVLIAVALVGVGSSVFHPEASRIAHLASGGRLGFAQSLFQVGGNFGSALGPLLAAVIVVARGQSAVLWFSLLALLGIAVLTGIGRWYRGKLALFKKTKSTPFHHREAPLLSRGRVLLSLAVLIALIFSKYFYLASMSSYYTFFLMGKFGLSIKSAQLHLFGFLFAVAAGTLLGGPVGDRIGRKSVIWASILGPAPFALALPYANLFWVGILTA